MSICDRCHNKKDLTLSIILARPGGHSWASMLEFTPLPHEPEQVCFDCLTDDEIARPLNSVVMFVLANLRNRIAGEKISDVRNSALISIEHTLAYFTVRDNDFDQDHRAAAIRALRGLLESR